MVNKKGTGVDSIDAEMLHTNLSTCSRVLTDMLDTVLDIYTTPSDWNKGCIINSLGKATFEYVTTHQLQSHQLQTQQAYYLSMLRSNQ